MMPNHSDSLAMVKRIAFVGAARVDINSCALDNPAMETGNDRRRRKLKGLCDRFGVKTVAERAGLNDQTLTQIIKGTLLPLKRDGTRSPRSLGDPAAFAIEKAFDLGRGWFDSDDTPPLEGANSPVLAQLMSLRSARVVPTMSWDQPMLEPLPSIFRLALRDDAMAPRARAGVTITFAATNKANPDDGVLITDADGNLYFRRLVQRTPGHWQAVAENPAYQTLDSIQDKLSIIAVLIAVDGSWSGSPPIERE